MAKVLIKNYIPFDINILSDIIDPLTFDIYLKLGQEKVVTLFAKETPIDQNRLKQYIAKGVKYLFYHDSDRDNFQNLLETTETKDPEYINKIELQVLEDQLDSFGTDSIKILEKKTHELTTKCINELFQDIQINNVHIDNTIKLIKQYVSILITAPEIISRLLLKIDENSYFHYHSLSVSVLSIFISRIVCKHNERMQEICGLGGFVHDIGKSMSIDHELNPIVNPYMVKSDTYIRHPDKGVELLCNTANIPEEVTIIVKQHHERIDGKGFPNKVPNIKLYHPAKIIAVANEFSKLISKYPFGKSQKPLDAIQLMKDDRGCFDIKILEALESIYKKR